MIKSAYQNISKIEQEVVDAFVKYACEASEKKCVPVTNILNKPLPSEIIKETRGLLNKPLVQAAINEKLQQFENAKFLDKNRIIKEHNLLAFSNIADFLKINEYGQPEITLDNADREKLSAIQKLKITNGLVGTTIELKMYDKQVSLNYISKLVNLEQIDPVSITGDDNLDLDAKYQKLLEQTRKQ